MNQLAAPFLFPCIYCIYINKCNCKKKFFCYLQRQKFEAEDTSCSDTSCTISIQVPPSESLYCVSVQGFSDEFAIQSEESEERCIDIPPKHPSGK